MIKILDKFLLSRKPVVHALAQTEARLTERMVRLEKYSDMRESNLRAFQERGTYGNRELEFGTLLKQNQLIAYEAYSWIYACVRAISNAIVKLPFNIGPIGKDGGVDKENLITSGRLYNLFHKPNSMQNYANFMHGMVTSIQLTGNCYMEKGGRDARIPTEMYMLRPDWVEIEPDPIRLVGRFLYRVNGVPIYLLPDEVAHFKLFHPRSELYGLAPLSSIRNAVTTDWYIVMFQQNYFKQGGVCDHYIAAPEELSDKNFERLKQQMRNEYQGVDRSHLLGILDNGMEVKTVAGNQADKLALDVLRNQLRNEVLAAFGVTPIMVSCLDAATYNNADAQKKSFYENTVQPLCHQLKEFWCSEFLSQFGFTCEYDFSGVHSLQENEKEKAETAKAYVQGGIITPNEAREKFLKMKPIQGGDELIMTGKVETVEDIDAGVQASGGGGDFGKTAVDTDVHPLLPDNRPAIPDNGNIPMQYPQLRKRIQKSIYLAKHAVTMHKQLTKHRAAIAPALNGIKAEVKKLIEANSGGVE
jgi:HK97 family phage portal protein